MKKIISCLLFFLVLTGYLFTLDTLAFYTYSSSEYWNFGNNSYLTFSQDANFTSVPKQGSVYDSALVGYWAMDETTGTLVNDSSGIGNNGNATGVTTIVSGKHGNARYFNGSGAIVVDDSQTLKLNLTDFSLAATIKLDSSGNGSIRTILRKGITGYNPFYALRVSASNKVEFTVRDYPEPAHGYTLTSNSAIKTDEWVTITVTFNYTSKLSRLYINGVSNVQSNAIDFGDISNNKTFAIGRASDSLDQYFKGSIDEVKIFNRTLSANEVASLDTLPDPAILSDHYSFVDAHTGNVMIFKVENSTSDIFNSTFVNCTNFFSDNKLIFTANNSATVNVWTNLGKPVSIENGFWGSENYTTTLTLNVFFYWRTGLDQQPTFYFKLIFILNYRGKNNCLVFFVEW